MHILLTYKIKIMKAKNKIIITTLIFVCFSISFLGCEKEEKEKPGPISVENSITPSTINSGSSIHWSVKVSNLGDEIEINKIHVKEEFISGWAQGLGTVEMDLPISNSTIGAHETKIVYEQTSPVYNTGATDIQAKNTVTVYSNGGEESDVVIYTITMAKKKGRKIEVHTLLNSVPEKIIKE